MEISGLMTTVLFTLDEKNQEECWSCNKKKCGPQGINKIAYNDRLIMVKCKVKPSDIVIIQVYFPTTEADDNEVKQMYTNQRGTLTIL